MSAAAPILSTGNPLADKALVVKVLYRLDTRHNKLGHDLTEFLQCEVSMDVGLK